MPLIRIKFFPDDYNLYYAFLEGPADTTIEHTDAKLREIARYIMADGPGCARSAAGSAGFVFNEDYEQEFGHNLGTVTVPLPDRKVRAFRDPIAHLDAMRKRLNERFAGEGFEIRMRAEKDGPPTGKDVNIQIVGPNERAVLELSDALLRALREDPALGPHLTDLTDNRGRPARVFRLDVNQSQDSGTGIDPRGRRAAGRRRAGRPLHRRLSPQRRKGGPQAADRSGLYRRPRGGTLDPGP